MLILSFDSPLLEPVVEQLRSATKGTFFQALHLPST